MLLMGGLLQTSRHKFVLKDAAFVQENILGLAAGVQNLLRVGIEKRLYHTRVDTAANKNG